MKTTHTCVAHLIKTQRVWVSWSKRRGWQPESRQVSVPERVALVAEDALVVTEAIEEALAGVEETLVEVEVEASAD